MTHGSSFAQPEDHLIRKSSKLIARQGTGQVALVQLRDAEGQAPRKMDFRYNAPSMSWLELDRAPEPEVMGEANEVAAYASAAAQKYLDALDDTLVEQVFALGARRGWLLDIGSGPGGIPLKLAARCPELRVVGVDRSAQMVRAAGESARRAGLAHRASFLVADAARLPFATASFDGVISNSLLHHLPRPASAFDEMARVVKPSGRIVLRDLRRPSRFLVRLHVAWFGRHYSGLMKKLYGRSVRAAYTARELKQLLGQSRLAGARIFCRARTHLGFVWSGEHNGSR